MIMIMKKMICMVAAVFLLNSTCFAALPAENAAPSVVGNADVAPSVANEVGEEDVDAEQFQIADEPPLSADMTEPAETKPYSPPNDGKIYGEGSELFPEKYYAINGYPDYISYVFETGGEMVEDTQVISCEFGVVNATEQQKNEIISTFSSTVRIEFVECEYSYAERDAMIGIINSLEDDYIISAMLIYNTEEILVDISTADLQTEQERIQRGTEYEAKLNELIGAELVVVQWGEYATTEDMGIAAAAGIDAENNNLFFLYVAAAVVVVIGLVAVMTVRKRAAVTVRGDVVTSGKRISRKDAVTLVSSCTQTPDAELFEQIKKKIDE